jgi:hypothetical protein
VVPAEGEGTPGAAAVSPGTTQTRGSGGQASRRASCNRWTSPSDGRASGTNDEAGSAASLLRWTSPWSMKALA